MNERIKLSHGKQNLNNWNYLLYLNPINIDCFFSVSFLFF